MRFSEETLMAYADGELDADTRAAVDAAMLHDSDLADAVALQIENRQALSSNLHAAFDNALDEPIPARLLTAANAAPPANRIADASVSEIAAARVKKRESRERRWRPSQWGAIAASLLLGVLIGRFALDRNEGLFVTELGRVTARGELSDALSMQAGGALARDTGIQMGVSYLTKNGEYCRTFTLRDESTVAGLACRRQDDWTIDALTRTNANASGAYRMAGAAIPALLLGIVESTIAGDPLDAEQEADARERGWQR
jgi:hypothetical protein